MTTTITGSGEPNGADPQYLALADLRHSQLRSLRAQVSKVAEASPYYRAVLGGNLTAPASFEEFYASVPAIRKSAIIDDASRFPPFGRLLCVPPGDIVRYYAHPGPQVFAWSRDDQDSLVSMYAQGISTTGFDAADIVDVTFQYGWVMAGTIWDLAVQKVGAAVVPGGAGGTTTHVENLRALGVTGLMGFPTYIEEIAIQASVMGIDPRLDLAVRKILVIGELRGSDAKERLRAMYGADYVREAYGTSEIGLVAAECSADGNGMHLHQDVHAEVRDRETGALVENGEPGELILTPLRRTAMPILRFRTGDITEYYDESPCRCGRTSPRIGPILGRASDLFRVKGVFLVPGAVDDAIRSVLDQELKYQLVISRPNVRDHLVLRVDSDQAHSDRTLADDLVKCVKNRCKVTVEVEILRSGGLDGETEGIVDTRVPGSPKLLGA